MNIWFTWEIFVNAIVIFAEAYLLYKQLGIKKRKIPFMYLGIAIFIVAISIFNYINIQMTINIATGLTIYATRLIFTLLMILFAFLIFEGSVSEKFLWSFVPMFLSSIADAVGPLILSGIFGINMSFLAEFGYFRFWVTVIHICVIVVACIALANAGAKKKKMYIPKSIRIILIFIIILGTISVDVLIDNTFIIAENGVTVTNVGEIFISATFLLIVFFTFLLVTRVGILSQENMEIELELQQSKLEHEFFKTIEITMEELRETRHDIKNHFRTMQVLLARKNYLKLKDYFEKMNGEIDTLTDIVITPDKVLNSIIYSKMLIMKAENIEFTHCINDTSNISISEYDLCSILGNLLDNSIEACRKLDFSLRHVDLIIKRKENMLIINLSNSCNGEYKYNNNGKYITTKAEMGHGLGLRHIERILADYHGHMQIKSTLNNFVVKIFLPCG